MFISKDYHFYAKCFFLSRKTIYRVEAITNIDADEPIVDNDDNESDEEFEDDEDDTAALLAELERIKKERSVVFFN